MTAAATPTIAQAYRVCEEVTREQARNFSYGIRLLPTAKRQALSAVYALARRIDDIGDGDLPDAEKRAGLDAVRRAVADLEAASADPVLAAVADAARRFPLPLSAFTELVDGVEMDVDGTSYASFDDLVVYCRRVAGTVGRLCLGIYGSSDMPRAQRLADDLGVALQQTNVLRDVREDLLGGRVYLPADDLASYGVTLAVEDGVLGGPAPALAALVRFAAHRARDWYDAGLPLLDLLDRRSAACTAAMAGIYVRLNARIAADPAAITTQRLSLPGSEKAGVAVRSLLG
ncbi:MAG: presqualene diphosphate synthase HpnD, partial [Mycobacteriales bacterium]